MIGSVNAWSSCKNDRIACAVAVVNKMMLAMRSILLELLRRCSPCRFNSMKKQQQKSTKLDSYELHSIHVDVKVTSLRKSVQHVSFIHLD
ncbi:hypothetical protein SERLA73DRAFT_140243 [Serpula lacrymans var. lacrymans S7.3]|uniref:Uncharacterized protein n=2 Tax=Serpula lacrymans var. lacrymans TaxID=341189 RepID=F8Q4X5_SERL3|nr:uncharacterized protein SERLADRAFT_394945 [Serpula lacrymans var. lacrymans S7.9]EGN96602.1 hypothetical protein SERLA73DRAFT_140243 [Serpula lacrymans var. lacrymans S7.3]EGO22172.1 hypothetical protein SERLADRAFT_394945 [Serpula lacrymans var. lacrymans S7.9]